MKRFLAIVLLILTMLSLLPYTVLANPSTVTLGISDSGNATNYTPQRKLFYCNGTVLGFYTNNSFVKFRASTDWGATWGQERTAFNLANTVGYYFSVRQYNVSGVCYIYIAYANATGPSVWFVRNTMYSSSRFANGTHYLVETTNSLWFYRPPVDVEVSSTGSVFASYSYNGRTAFQLLRWRVAVNTNNDGSGGVWTATTFTIASFASTNYYAYGGLTRLTTGRVYGIFTSNTVAWTKGSLYDGTLWSAVETINSISPELRFGMVGYGDHVLFATTNFTDSTYYFPYFQWRNYTSGTWSTATKASTYTDVAGISIAVNATNGDCWMFWKAQNASASNKIVYAKRTFSTGAYATTVWSGTESDLYTLSIVPFQYLTVSRIGVLWEQGISPKNIRYDMLDLSAVAPSVWTWRIGTLSAVVGSEKWTIQKTFRETGQAATLDSKRFLAWFSWKPNALSLALSATFYQRLVFMWKPSVLSWVVGSERIVRTVPFPQEYDSSSALGGLGLLMNYRYPATSVSETFVSQAFVKHLVFRQTGLSETLGSLYWTKIISFITYTETTVCQATGSERWLMQLVFNRGDSSSFLSSSAWLMRFRYDESSMTETVSSREFIKNLVFRETGLSKTLGFLAWNKVIEFFSFTESAVSQTVGSVSWAVGAVQSHLILVMVILLVLCLLGGVLFLAYRRKTE